jgi:hypothetical protein
MPMSILINVTNYNGTIVQDHIGLEQTAMEQKVIEHLAIWHTFIVQALCR